MSNKKDHPEQLQSLIKSFHSVLCGDSKAQSRVKAVNTLLNGGHDLKVLEKDDINKIWESIFFALWHSEMGRGCEEIIAAIERACQSNYRLTRAGFKIIAAKWYGLDQYRVDKVSHLARHLLPALLKHQIENWIKKSRKRAKLGTRDVSCKKLLRRTLRDITKSYGLCYFILEILAEEISKSCSNIYEQYHMITGYYEMKANLIVFLYRQVIDFTTTVNLDARLLRTFDQYVIKRFIDTLLANESQLTQILVTLRLHQTLDQTSKRSSTPSKCKSLLHRWSSIIQDTHENCINGDYFPIQAAPTNKTIRIKPHLT